MSKRIRRDTRRIAVGSIETAERIKEYCVENFIEDHVYSSVQVIPKWVTGKIIVKFYCTADEWKKSS